MSLNLFDTDKAGHYIAGSVVGALGALWAVGPLHRPALAWAAALAAAAVVGALKELADWLDNRRRLRAGQPPPHGVELADWLATTLGALPVAAPLGLITLMARGVI